MRKVSYSEIDRLSGCWLDPFDATSCARLPSFSAAEVEARVVKHLATLTKKIAVQPDQESHGERISNYDTDPIIPPASQA